MNGSSLLCLALALGLGLAATLRAEPSPPPSATKLPPGPILNRAPKFSRWVITSEPDKASVKSPKKRSAESKAGETTLRTTVTKTGNLIHQESVDGRGVVVASKWCVGDLQVNTRPEWAEPLISSPENRYDAAYTDYSKSDFPEFGWVSASNFVTVEKMDDRACLAFKGLIKPMSHAADPTAPPPSDATANPADHQEDPQTAVPAEAYVDYYMRLPVKLVWDGEVRSYAFEAPPTAMLVIPESISAVLTARQEQMNGLKRTPAGP